MSKWKQIAKTRMLREKRNPQRRVEHITELRRQIKFYKGVVGTRTKEVAKMERDARWARYDLEHTKSEIVRMEKELQDYEAYDNKQKGT